MTTSPPTRAQLHGQVMRALISTGADPSLAAAHARAGHLVGDRDAIAVLEAAGRAALLLGGLESAMVDFRAASDMAGTKASSQLLITLADTEAAAGNAERAAAVCRRLLATAPEPLLQSQALTILARAAFAAGRPDEVERHFQAAAEAAGGHTAQQGAVLSEALATCSALLDPRRVLSWAVQARKLLDQQTGLDRTVADTAWAATASVTGDQTGLGSMFAALAEGRVAAAIKNLPVTLAVWTAVCAHEPQ